MNAQETVGSILKDAFDSNPNGVVIDWEHQTQITYEQLRVKIQRLMQVLRDHATPGTPVVVCLPRSVAQIVSIVTIAWLGAVYVPLDPDIPQARLEGLLKRLEKPVILGNAEFLKRYPDPQLIDGVYFDVEKSLAQTVTLDGAKSLNSIVTRQPEDLAIILFTSGSTGEPKGVKLSNRNIIEPIRHLSEQQNTTTRSRILQFAGPAFDVHMLDIFCGLFNAATLCLVTKDRLLSQLAFWINKMEANMIHLTPSMLAMLRPADVPGIRYMLSSGEAITQEIIDTWASSVVLLNLYGPCEASSIVGSRLLPGDSASIIGKVTAFSEIFVLRDDGQPASPGEAGEIFCTGKTVFLGYLGDEAMTRSKFRAQGPGLPKLFGTGDVGTLTEDGALRLFGRIDSQVKINGQRVELPEIDQALSTIAARAVTRWRKDPRGQIRLHSFVTESSAFCGPSNTCSLIDNVQEFVDRLLSVCHATLPSYMVPEIIPVSAIPLNASEKIDQKRLDLLLDSHLQASSRILEADAGVETTATEQTVARIVSEQLNRPVRSARHNLLSLGMSSLDTMAVLKCLHLELGVSLSLREVLQSPTVQQVAKMVDEQRLQTGGEKSASSYHVPNEEAPSSVYEVTTSPSQDRIFAADKLLANSAYNCNFTLRLPSMDLNVERLHDAVLNVCAQHEVLHSTYHDVETESTSATDALVRQKVWPIAELPPKWEVVGYKHLQSLAMEKNRSTFVIAMDRIAVDAEILFDLGRDSPVRATVYELGSQQWVVHFNIHHISMDERSFHVCAKQIEECYSSLASTTRRPDIQYTEFANWQRSTTADTQYQNHMNWWVDRIGDEMASLRAEDLGPLPPQLPLPEATRDKSQLIMQELDPVVFNSFEQNICADSTAFVGWLALFQALMARVSRKNEFLLAVPATERSVNAKFFDVVGFCLNTILIPSVVEKTDSFKALLARTQDTFLSCMSHSVPYEDVVTNLAAKRPSGRSSLQLNVMFVLHDQRSTGGAGSDRDAFLETAEYIQLPTKGADFPLIVHIDPNYSPPRLILQHRFDAFRASFVETLGRGFASLLQGVVKAGLEAPLNQMNLISSEDAQRLDTWSVASKIPEQIKSAWIDGDGLTLVDLFQNIVDTHPKELAIETISGERLTYEELYARSTTLAQYITRTQDVAGKVVMVAMDKSCQLVISVFAILLAGATFLMVDPTHKAILNESKVRVSNARLVITDLKSHAAIKEINIPEGVSVLPYEEATWSSEKQTPVRSAIPASAGAWLCFTSGSTGNPKCFSIPHSSATASLMGLIDYFHHGPGTRMPLLTNVVFDVCISSMLSPLLSGGTLCIAPAESFVTNLEETISALRVTHMEATPSVVATLSGPGSLSSLRSLSLGGEPPSREVTCMWMDKVDVYNIYCPAECTIIGFIHHFQSTDDPVGMMRNIGRKTPAVRSMILDSDKQPVLPGAVGYLHIGSYQDGRLGQLSTGYLAPQSANAKFSEDPRVGRIYNSGDLAYYDLEGNVHLIGREDDQVKLHGIRFDLSDVEVTADAALAPGGKSIALIASPGEKALVAFVHHPSWADAIKSTHWVSSLAPETTTVLRGLRTQLEGDLHDVMVPKYWIPISWIPQGNTGKADRKRLQKWFEELSVSDPEALRSYATLTVSTDTSDERWQLALQTFDSHAIGKPLRDCWQQTLGLSDSKVALDESFFHSGGDSISAIRFCSRARGKGIVGCTVGQLYRTPSLSALLKAIEPLQEESEDSVSVSTDTTFTGYSLLSSRPHFDQLKQDIEEAAADTVWKETGAESIWPVRDMQKAMLLQSASERGRYIVQVMLTLSGPLDVARLQNAWRLVQEAHPSLRTTFIPVYRANAVEYFAMVVKPSGDYGNFQPFVMDLPSGGQFEEYLEADRQRGFRFGDLFHRLTVFQSSEQTHHLVLTIHHAINDGWSLGIMWKDFAEAYHAGSLPARPSPAPFLAQDLARDPSSALDYWSTYLDGFQPFTVRSRVSDQSKASSEGKMASKRIIVNITPGQITSCAKAHMVTSATVLEAVTAIFLARATGRQDVAFGITTSGRNAAVDGITEMVGLFINTLPVRVKMDDGTTLNSLLAHLAEDFASAIPNEHVALSQIFSKAQASQSLFDTVLVYENFDIHNNYQFDENLLLSEIDGREFSEFPFTIVVEHTPKGTQIVFKWTDSLLSAGEADSWINQFASLLSEVVQQQGDQSLDKLSVATNYREFEHVKKIYNAHNEVVRETPSEATLVSLFKQNVAKHEQKTALYSTEQALTFKELDEQSDRLAYRLIRENVRPGDVVPIVFSRSPSMIVAMLGVLKAGAAYCPLDPKAPSLRLKNMISKVQGRTVVIGKDTMASEKIDSLQDSGFKVNVLEDLLQENQDTHTTDALPSPASSDRCYVLFTSGTTGEPKGCILSHGAVSNAVQETARIYGTSVDTRMLLFANYIFDASVLDIYGCLSTGATLCFASEEELMTDLNEVVRRESITSLHLTPSMIRFLDPEHCITLQTLISGGEKLPTSLRETWAPRLRLFDGYGPTECAVQVSATPVTDTTDQSTIQNVISGNFMVLLDQHGLVPRVGQIGEICISGKQLFNGYIGEPDLTTQATATMTSLDDGLHLYRTGDLGQYTAGMNIQILGRKDSQVKISGQRIEVQEVENVLASAPGVVVAGVAVWQNQLVAVAQAREATETMKNDEWRSFCEARLPAQLIPSHFFQCAVPLNASKKVDRRRLAELVELGMSEQLAKDSVSAFQEPLTETEAYILKVASDLVGTQVVNPETAFPSLGLTSLLLMELRAIVSHQYQRALSFSDLNSAGTARRLASRLDSASPIILPADNKALQLEDQAEALSTQRRMWLAQQRLGDETYNVCSLLTLKGISATRLVEAIHRFVDSTDEFKLKFTWDSQNNHLVQTLKSEATVPVDLVSMQGLNEIQEASHKYSQRIFDLEEGPMAHFAVFDRGSGNVALFYNIHHILVDEWTTQQMLSCILRVYADPSLQFKYGSSLQYAAVAEQHGPKSQLYETCMANLLRQLDDVPPFDTTNWPTAAAGITSREAGNIIHFVAAEYFDQFKKTCLADGISWFSALLGLFQLLLHRYTSTQELGVLVPVSMRGALPSSSDVFGNLVNTALIPSSREGEKTLRQFIERTAASVGFAMDSVIVPFEDVLARLKSTVSDHSVIFVAQEQNAPSISNEVKNLTRESFNARPVAFDLQLTLTSSSEGIVLDLQYDRSKFEASYMDEIAMGYAQLLRTAFSICDTPLKDIDLSTPEQRTMMETFANFKTVKPPCRDALLHQLFEQTAVKQPQATAIDHWDGQQHTLTTYKELDEKATALASHLQTAYDVRVNDIVPIFVDQGTFYVIAVLAVLKTGATFTPMAQDGTWPADRVIGIVNECSAKVVIADIETPEELSCPTLQIHSIDLSVQVTAPVLCEATPDTISYILWTSGTTGAPKGVMIPHSSAVTYFREAAAHLFQGTPADRTFQFASPVFDASMEDLFHTFVEGGTLCTAPRELLLSDLQNVFRALRPTAADLTPTVISLLEPFVGSFRVLVTAGEPQNEKVRADWTKSSTTLINACGPAENTVGSYFGPVSPTSNIRSIGHPFASVVALVFDAFGKLCPRHVIGTIWLGGSQLFKEYLNKPELTARVFINHPKYGRLWNSGDVAYYDSEGHIIHCGRGDDQVKIRGQRLELSGINSMIEESELVRRALVMKDKEKLVAFIVWADEPEKATELIAETLNPNEHSKLKDLRESMKIKASSAMIPSIWIQVNKVPLRQSGKADHRLLRSLITHQESSEDESGRPPASAVEQALHDACCQTLGLRAVGMDRNVFELGMDSFLVMRFISEIRKQLPRCKLTLRHVAEVPILEALASGIESDQLDQQPPVQLDLPSVSKYANEPSALVPASSVQARFSWAQALLGDATYNVPSFYRLRGLAPYAVETSLESILSEHAIFRTTFVSGDSLQQQLHPTCQIKIQRCDLTSMDEGAALQKMREMCIDDAATVFDLATGPLARVMLFLLPNGSNFLYLNFHHIIIDEQSIRLFAHEVARRASEGSQSISEINEGPQYADFAEQEQKLLANSEVQAESRKFWSEYLSNSSPITVPQFHAGSGKPHRAMHHYDFTLPREGLDWIRSQGITNFSAFLTLYMILLRRVWNVADATVTIPVSQRAGATGMYGCFINTIPVRAQMSGENEVGPFFSAMSRNLFRALQKSYLPYDQILDAANVATDDLPLMFIYHEASKDVFDGLVDAHHLLRETESETTGQAKFPVSFSVTLHEQDGQCNLSLSVEYDTSKIKGKSIEALCGHFQSVVQAVGKSLASTMIDQLDILTPSETEIMTAQQQSTVIDKQDQVQLVHQMVHEQAIQFPDNIACDFEGTETVTYRELWNKVEHISAALLPFRNASEGKVGIFMDAGIDRIASILAVLNCGMAWVPLEVTLPVSRLAAIVEDCEPQVILTSEALDDKYGRVLRELDEITGRRFQGHQLPVRVPTSEAPAFAQLETQPNELAYILYTSGTTGKPKGVQIEHLSLLNTTLASRSIYRANQDSRFLQFVPWTFDVSIMDIFASLTIGATLCLGRRDFLMANFNSIFSRMNITHVAATPTIISLLTPEEAPTLKVLLIGGESMSAKVRDLWADKATLVNAYGPTETCIWGLTGVIHSQSEPGNIGKPLSGCTAYVLNAKLALCPVGTIGQLAIGGVQLSRGYLNRPEENQAFVDHAQLGRIYLTGDFALINHDQTFTCLGRMDNQTKIRGQRIELEEIANIAIAHPAVHNVISMVVERDDTSSLALLFEPSGKQSSTADENDMRALDAGNYGSLIEELHEKLLSTLPSYAVPTLYIPVWLITVNANGKTDRKRAASLVADLDDTALMSYNIEAQGKKLQNIELETEAEFLIASAMCQILGVQEVYGNSNFFSLSGNSLSALRLCSALRKQGFKLSVKDVYNHPTVAELAANVKYSPHPNMSSNKKLEDYGSIHPTPIMDWFVNQKKVNPSWNNQSNILKLSGSSAFTDIAQAWERIMDVHPALRIRCNLTPEQPRIYIPSKTASQDCAIRKHSISSEDDMSAIISQTQSSLDIKQGPISALTLIETPSDAYCLVAIHHLAIDIVSWQIIFDDLEQLLSGVPILPEFESFRKWSLHVRERQRAAQATIPEVAPTVQENSLIASNFKALKHLNTHSSVKSIETTLSTELTELCLKGANKTHGTEPVELLLAGLTLALHRWKQISTYDLTLESHGRELQNEAFDFSRTVGWFTYLYNATFSITDNTTLADLLAHTKSTRREASQKADFSVSNFKNADAPVMMFNYSGAYNTGKSAGVFEPVTMDAVEASVDDPVNVRPSVFDFNCGAKDGVMTLSVLYSSVLHREEDVQGLLGEWEGAVKEIVGRLV
ncbi:acetyl-CoA synthetase-like protein [Aspergillus ellipticus CBS 707.79]|uniref:Acetyl-CoA synthetase-like protein n=1 Tax=Aspergillus ellipticus CBS 707.79 TaxID=1448320 RepID=A0A319DHU7_9EURO|nr:acetyl-CoA synthetase-like protein [Aspergillus ellipticus CBS 707.79]